jgi:hypothetical protein
MIPNLALREPSERNRLSPRFLCIEMNSDSYLVKRSCTSTRSSRGEVADGANQSIGAHLKPRGFVSKILLIVSTKRKQSGHGIEPVAAQPESANVVRGTCGISTFGSPRRPVDPVQAWLSGYDAFTEKYSKIKYHVKSSQVSFPWHQMPEEDLYRLGVAGVCYEHTAIAWQPGRDRSKARFFQVHVYAELCQEGLKRAQALVPMLHEMTEIIPAASRELSYFLVEQMPWAIWPLPVERLIGGIIDQSLRHAASVVDEMLRFFAQPTEQMNLRDQQTMY